MSGIGGWIRQACNKLYDQLGTTKVQATCISPGATYEEAYATFRWEVPARFNIARAICDRHAERTPDAAALLYEEADGQLAAVELCARCRRQANRLANALEHLGVGARHDRRRSICRNARKA